jgi:hypothetical protein
MYHPVKRFKIKQIVIFARIYTVKMAKLSVLNEDLAEMMLRMDDSRLEDARLEDARCLTTTLSKNKKIAQSET